MVAYYRLISFVEFGWVRELNEGVERIYTEMQEMLLNDPVFAEPDRTKVLLTLENNIVARAVRQGESMRSRIPAESLGSLGEYELAAVRFAFARGRVTTRDLSRLIGRSTRSSSSILKALEAKGILIWHGTSRNDLAQYYALGEESSE